MRLIWSNLNNGGQFKSWLRSGATVVGNLVLTVLAVQRNNVRQI